LVELGYDDGGGKSVARCAGRAVCEAWASSGDLLLWMWITYFDSKEQNMSASPPGGAAKSDVFARERTTTWVHHHGYCT